MRRSKHLFRISATLASLILLVGCSPSAKTDTADRPEPTRSNGAAFDSARAFDLLKQQVELGARVPNTEPHAACAEFIQKNLSPYADHVTTQSFSADANGKKLSLTNIIAKFNPSATSWVLLAAHWDTRPTADYEVLAEKRKLPIPGANDGASGTAVLLELARVFHSRKPDIGVVMVFFDGEDYGPGEKAMFLGSKYYASEAAAGRTSPLPKQIRYGILLDMIGDADLRIPQELHSLRAAPDVVKKVWAKAAKLGYSKEFPPVEGSAILDDHVPLIGVGIKCINIIDFDYGPWHTLDDTPDKCSPESLKAVGEVVAAVVYDETP